MPCAEHVSEAILKSILIALSAISGVLSAACLCLGWQETPLEIQTLSGARRPKHAFRRGRRFCAVVGFILFDAAAFALQLLAVVM